MIRLNLTLSINKYRLLVKYRFMKIDFNPYQA